MLIGATLRAHALKHSVKSREIDEVIAEFSARYLTSDQHHHRIERAKNPFADSLFRHLRLNSSPLRPHYGQALLLLLGDECRQIDGSAAIEL